ncbi:AAA domain-containing protein [Nocardia goodfellowii]|uniref:DNA polymerase III delta prime subunit n=1 Tax=Nocardia goodfellowii TaxID=882446 RepID=A0ABS4QQ65_9NOCA|nr:AAA domain-containing protein [Nocardia goodfellowii]MBP2193844.1 DNA polymerase III delta prime subunit [Nocardia goodfellowii]
MLDPRKTAIVIHRERVPEDKTLEISVFDPRPDRAFVRFGGSKTYPFGWDRVVILDRPTPVSLGPHTRLFADGSAVDATEAYLFTGPPQAGSWWHVLKSAGGWQVYRADQVEVLPNGAATPRAQDVLAYWRGVAAQLSDVLLRNHKCLEFVHSESALARILEQAPIEPRPADQIPLPLYPFRTNISQSAAVLNALRYPISVIDGPPGTGKTQTILNIIASIVCRPGATVGVVSFSNSAVDNVFEKLTKEGFGIVAANLGRSAKRDEFFNGQGPRNAAVDAMLRAGFAPAADAAAQLDKVNSRLATLLEHDRLRAELRHQLHAFQLEKRHFQSFFDRHEVPDAADLPLLRRYSAGKLLDFIRDTDPQWIRDTGWGRIVGAMNRYFKYRALRMVDAGDVDVVLRIERLYYEKKIAELERRDQQLTKMLEGKKFDELLAEQANLSRILLQEALCTRYGSVSRKVYDWRYVKQFSEFAGDYPLILSTCHSLQKSIGPSALLDYLIIDEASQVDLVTVGPALACARNLIVVGDLEQLPPVTNDRVDPPPPPDPGFDYRHSVLSSIIDLYRDQAPRRMLREHYRCDPDIIGFCNRTFYGGKLIPYTRSTPGSIPMAVVRTQPGNHMRHIYGDDDPRSNGRSNQREIDIILHEVLPWIADIPSHQIGVTTPYRRQADKATEALIEAIESDTVHKFQGREKHAVVMTTVLDDSPSSQRALQFADDPNLINVAVSRAMRMFVLVTHHSELPMSRYLRDLIGYIRYRDPNHAVIDSDIVSIFDLLYTELNQRRRAHPRIRWGRTDVPSEDIALAMLEGVIAEPLFSHLAVHRQVYLHHVFPPELDLLDERQRAFVRDRSSFDFVLFNRITNANVGAIEVDGFSAHEAVPEQRARDELKNEICRRYNFQLLRLPTTGSGEAAQVRRFLGRLP